jgi:hypothetical protein
MRGLSPPPQQGGPLGTGLLRAVATPLAGKWSTLPTVRRCAATSQSGTQAISIEDDKGAAA